MRGIFLGGKMIALISVMFLGIALGYALRRHAWTLALPRTISAVIFVLLFLMGFSIGANKGLLGQLASLGGQAFVISMAGTLGSIFCAWGLWRWWRREK